MRSRMVLSLLTGLLLAAATLAYAQSWPLPIYNEHGQLAGTLTQRPGSSSIILTDPVGRPETVFTPVPGDPSRWRIDGPSGEPRGLIDLNPPRPGWPR